jgi:hypothetical protein
VRALPNIFLLYMPPSNREAMVHYEDTIRSKVAPERVDRHVAADVRRQLDSVFARRPMAVWGSRDTSANRAKFEKMRPGDEILIVEGDTIKLLGKVAATTVNPSLSRELWKNLRVESTAGWDLIYFIANPIEIDLPFAEFCRLLGYEPNYQLRGFTIVSRPKVEAFFERYDDLYAVLLLIKRREPIHERPSEDPLAAEPNVASDQKVRVEPEDVDAALSNGTLSDHLRMQWTLIGLGVKCGSRVWVPAGDQKRIREQYQFHDFEKNFAAGLDTQTRYVENIDVVYKEEFRIDAAFEIENSTTIYSGLLRFADLSLVAPNTVYPLFIVAPQEKRNRLYEQLRRPIFQKLRMHEKVRYLSYDAVTDIDRFARGMERGLNVDLIIGKSESIRLDRPS